MDIAIRQVDFMAFVEKMGTLGERIEGVHQLLESKFDMVDDRLTGLESSYRMAHEDLADLTNEQTTLRLEFNSHLLESTKADSKRGRAADLLKVIVIAVSSWALIQIGLLNRESASYKAKLESMQAVPKLEFGQKRDRIAVVPEGEPPPKED